MFDNIKHFLSNRINAALVGALALILIGASFGVYKVLSKPAAALPEEVIELGFDPEGPYAILEPRKDGYAVGLNMLRVASYKAFSYQLVYSSLGTTAGEAYSEGPIDRAAGALDTYIELNNKSEFSQELLFGTCSKGDTSSTKHCVFDKNVENGTLTLMIKQEPKKGDKTQKVYRMNTTWTMRQPDIALGKLTSADEHFIYTTKAKAAELSNTGFTLINDITGAPKFPDNKKVLGKVYALNVPAAKTLPAGSVIIETPETPSDGAQIGVYNVS